MDQAAKSAAEQAAAHYQQRVAELKRQGKWFTVPDVLRGLSAEALALSDSLGDRASTRDALLRLLGQQVVRGHLLWDRAAGRYKSSRFATAAETVRFTPRATRSRAELAWQELQRAGSGK